MVDAWLDEAARFTLLARLLYLAPPAALLLCAATAWWRWRAVGAPWRAAAAAWPGVAVAAAVVAAVLVASPPAMRMQFDESSLVAVSQGMHEARTASMATGAVPFEGAVVRLENTVDKRPPLFAFLVSVVHDLAGARIANAFVVNALLLGVGCVLWFVAVRARAGLVAGLAAPVLVAAVPIVAVCATSAGFELLATVLLTAVVLAALAAVASGGAPSALALLLGTGGLFVLARYESLPVLLLVLGLVGWRLRRQIVCTRGLVATAVAVAWIAAPVLVLLRYARDPKFYPEAGGRPLLAFEHLAAHVPPFVQQWFAPALTNPLPGVLAIAAGLACAWRLWQRRAGFGDLLVAVPVAAATGATLTWFYGDVRERTALRLFLPAACWTALAPLVVVAGARRAVAAAVLVGAVALAGLRLHAVARGAAFPPLRTAALAAAIEAAAAAVDDGVPEHGHTLWVSTAAQHLIVHGRAALSPASFARRADEVQRLARDGHVRALFVLTTPLDREFAEAYGDPEALVRATGAELLRRVATEAGPISVYRVPRR
ncbi:MAG: glycosyltransferase family 39 protein [Planctomycetes bacterium]|nr:glycosyltransferase family 39 protein [Planctomycetota bacterium]